MVRAGRCFVLLTAATVAAAPAALAHTGERGFVLLLPTGYYLAGGTLAVAATFLLLFFAPALFVRRVAGARRDLGQLPAVSSTVLSTVCFLFLLLLLAAGLAGSRDPLANPLPLTIWTLFWVGLTLLQAAVGNVWGLVNPWLAPYRLIARLMGRRDGDEPPLRYSERLGYWPAVLAFVAFAWFELIDLKPDDPERLTVAVAVYFNITLVGMILFGERAWLGRAECFTVFLGFIARLSPLQFVASPEAGGRPTLALVFPGAALARTEPLPASGVLFVLLTLATVSFDGLNKTFWWLDLGGINPLEFPGRSAVAGLNSLGLLAMWAALAGAYILCIRIGLRPAGGGTLRSALGAFVLSILPISLAYHFAHYLTVLLVNGQYAMLALNDPFGRGWDLMGIGHGHVTASFLSNYDSVSVIWKLQAGAIVAGHLLALAVAHMIAVERVPDARGAFLSQVPLAALMIGYTLFGLWLLAAPAAG
jgi:hypothetical protein